MLFGGRCAGNFHYPPSERLLSQKTEVGKSCNFDDFHRSWVHIWDLNVSPEVRYFLYMESVFAYSVALSVRALLKHRHLIIDDLCPLCNKSSETVFHMLFECELAKEAMMLGGFSELLPRTSVNFLIEMLEAWDEVNVEKVEGWAVLAWSLWFHRNQCVF